MGKNREIKKWQQIRQKKLLVKHIYAALTVEFNMFSLKKSSFYFLKEKLAVKRPTMKVAWVPYCGKSTEYSCYNKANY